jgi:hypothetical protein
MNPTRIGLAALVLVLLAAPVVAHVPTFPEDNTSPDRAVHVHDPVKSWSFFDSVESDQAKYYSLHFETGDQLSVSTYTPSNGAFTPSIVLMSPTLNGTDNVPDRVTVPEGWGAEVVAGEPGQSPNYEPFVPAANYPAASVNRTVEEEGHYLVAIYDPGNRNGQAGVAIGTRETFSVGEWVTVAFDRPRTHLWEGQHPLVVFGPLLVTLLLGGAVLLSRRPDEQGGSVFQYLLGGASLVILGAGISTLVQTGLALSRTGPTAGALVTALFVLVPVVCGLWGLRVASHDERALSGRTRTGLAVAGLASLATWAGYIVGPALFLTLALTPTRVLEWHPIGTERNPEPEG